MMRLVVLAAVPILVVAACIQTALPPVPVEEIGKSVSYVQHVEPILDRRCVVCHSCYNAPCQLNLASYEGLDRGGSKIPVYDSARLRDQAPTRLFVDADSTAAWRENGFFSVTDNDADGNYNDSLMLYLLDAKMRTPESTGEYRAEAADLTCPANPSEVGSFLTRHPNRGMPFGLPALSRDEYETLATWIQRGAHGPRPKEQAALTTPSAAAASQVATWEAFLNASGPKHAMTARYLFEHLFLAHISFSEADPLEFFRIVRSTTPPGEPIAVVATVRPYDDPGVETFYYRFRKIHSTIVYKTHMVVELNGETLARYKELFIEPEWLERPRDMQLGDERGANPFLIYAEIPPSSRYQFLLDNAEYMLRTFIRGPVCKGQVALNVINDHFWVMFLDPEADETLRAPDFLIAQSANLRLPTEQGSDKRLLGTFSNRYRERYRNFYRAKMELYRAAAPDGFELDSIWKGRRSADSPMLTIYRHFDSASVHKGALGDLPRTLWVIDYPQFERIYYALVAGFDVFGNLSHQVNVRRYMDYLRIEGELNFLNFLPEDTRLPTMQSWYLGDKAFGNVDADHVRSLRPTQIVYETSDPKRELVERVIDGHLLEASGIDFDRVNYSRSATEVPMPSSFETGEDILNGFRALTAPGTGFIKHVTNGDANLIFVRIKNYKGRDRFFTIVINRWHDNVNSMFGESSRLDPSKDSIDFIEGSVGAYPNFFLDVEAEDIPDLFDMLENFDESEEYLAKIRKYGVRRSDESFWELYDWFQSRLDASNPLLAGRYDLNRYYPDADSK
jgi:hypothetical protein